MNRINKLLFCVLAAGSFVAVAADIPSDYLGAQKFDKLKCFSDASQSCINATCLNSDQIDCQDNCKKLAEAKCNQLMNE